MKKKMLFFPPPPPPPASTGTPVLQDYITDNHPHLGYSQQFGHSTPLL